MYPCNPLCAKKTTSGRMLGMCYILCMSSSVWVSASGAQGGERGGAGGRAPCMGVGGQRPRFFFFGLTYFR
jgi:hypothetical protein